VTASSARPSSVSDGHLALGADEVHLWLCPRGTAGAEPLLRACLSRYAPRPPAAWRFTRNSNGKPAAAAAPRPLAFNLSHSHDRVAIAVTAGAPVGVDIEYCDPRRDLLRLARRFYHPEEVAALEQRDAVGCRDLFYDLWTVKEARIKARGGALWRDLTALRADPAETCWRLAPLPGYRLAIAVRDPRRRVSRLRVHTAPDSAHG